MVGRFACDGVVERKEKIKCKGEALAGWRATVEDEALV